MGVRRALLDLDEVGRPQRVHDLREIFNGLRYLVRTGVHWRMMPHDLPPWEAVYQQTQRWLRAGCFESMVHDLRLLLRVAAGRDAQPLVEARHFVNRCQDLLHKGTFQTPRFSTFQRTPLQSRPLERCCELPGSKGHREELPGGNKP